MVSADLRELVKAYEEGGKFIGVIPKDIAKANGLAYWVSQVILLDCQNGQTRYPLTLRSGVDCSSFLDCLQVGFSETIKATEDAITAGAKGGKDELRLDQQALFQTMRYVGEILHRNPCDPSDKVNAEVFYTPFSGSLCPNPREIGEIIEVTEQQMNAIVAAGVFEHKKLTPLSISVWLMYKARVLEGR